MWIFVYQKSLKQKVIKLFVPNTIFNMTEWFNYILVKILIEKKLTKVNYLELKLSIKQSKWFKFVLEETSLGKKTT